VIITGRPTDFCLNFSLTDEKLNSALSSASETLLLANVADAIVGYHRNKHDKKNNSSKREPANDGTDAQKMVKLRKQK
jgi:hypothetical protein